MVDEPKSTEQHDELASKETDEEPGITPLQAKDNLKITEEKTNEAHSTAETVKPTRGFKQKVLAWLKLKAVEANLADWGMVVFTFIIAGTTIVYTYYARRQWRVINNQLQEMETSNEIARTGQRAQVNVPHQIDITPNIENGKVIYWTPEITMVNDGNTGSYNTLEFVNIYTSEKEMPKDFGYPDNGNSQNSDLGPRAAELFKAPRIPIAAILSICVGSA